MKVVERSIEAIRPYEKNAKKHPESQVRQIAESIKAFGFNQPIVVDKDGVIIVGHGRYAAAIMLGLDKVPVLEVDITDEKAKAYRLADNKLNESAWDMKLVIPELREMDSSMVELTGFDPSILLEQMPVPKEESGAKCERCAEIQRARVGHRARSGHEPFFEEEKDDE